LKPDTPQKLDATVREEQQGLAFMLFHLSLNSEFNGTREILTYEGQLDLAQNKV
jgi:hypothetical protein